MQAMTPATPFQRLQAYWVYGGTTLGVLLMLLTPLITAGWALPALLTYLCLPAYMLHQFEEHDDDRFRRFVNEVIGKGRQALSQSDVYWVNVLGVWAFLALTLWAALRLDPGWSTLSAYLLLVNAVAHIGQSIALRRTNPGIFTAILFFVPLGLLLLINSSATLLQHVLAFLLTVALHAAIMLRVRFNLSQSA